MTWEIKVGDVLDQIATIPDDSIQCVVTSPPYWGLRNYQVDGQFGLEGSPTEYVEKLVEIFREVKRVLKPDGTAWLNLGDSYSSGQRSTQSVPTLRKESSDAASGKHKYLNNFSVRPASGGLASKQLVGIPWRAALALQDDGWWLRRDIIWSKPNPMPESVEDRPTSAHEYIFLLTKSPDYYYDHKSVRSPLKDVSVNRLKQGTEHQEGSHRAHGGTKTMKAVARKTDKQRGHSKRHAGFNDRWDHMTLAEQQANGASLRSVWHVATRPFSGAHFATYPEKLIEPCIKAGSAPGDTVLDPFSGSGTTGVVALKRDRNYIGIELNPEYAEMSKRRIADAVGVTPEEAAKVQGETQGRML